MVGTTFSVKVAMNQLSINWSFLSQMVYSGLRDGDSLSAELPAVGGRNFGGHGSEPSTMPIKP
jgi:hypothetical protein